MNEFAIEWVRGITVATITAPAGSWLKTRVVKLAEAYPDDVKIVKENEDGSTVAHAPVKFVKLSPPRKVSEKQRQVAAERLRKYHKQKAAQEDEEEWDEEDWEDEYED